MFFLVGDGRSLGSLGSRGDDICGALGASRHKSPVAVLAERVGRQGSHSILVGNGGVGPFVKLSIGSSDEDLELSSPLDAECFLGLASVNVTAHVTEPSLALDVVDVVVVVLDVGSSEVGDGRHCCFTSVGRVYVFVGVFSL